MWTKFALVQSTNANPKGLKSSRLIFLPRILAVIVNRKAFVKSQRQLVHLYIYILMLASTQIELSQWRIRNRYVMLLFVIAKEKEAKMPSLHTVLSRYLSYCNNRYGTWSMFPSVFTHLKILNLKLRHIGFNYFLKP